MQSLEKVVKGQRRNCPVPLMGHHLLGYLKKYIYISASYLGNSTCRCIVKQYWAHCCNVEQT